ncbi:MAG TPA: DUF5522 domain-containing protein [Acidobacteriaceae bacterium]|nr:DUF5522 domain-containing protein [Acidobacteriaceae bacterium]
MSEPSAGDSANKQATAEQRPTESRIVPTSLEAEDFYYENGLMVFTAAYHLKRGYCCNSGCRHCPFR